MYHEWKHRREEEHVPVVAGFFYGIWMSVKDIALGFLILAVGLPILIGMIILSSLDPHWRAQMKDFCK